MTNESLCLVLAVLECREGREDRHYDEGRSMKDTPCWSLCDTEKGTRTHTQGKSGNTSWCIGHVPCSVLRIHCIHSEAGRGGLRAFAEGNWVRGLAAAGRGRGRQRMFINLLLAPRTCLLNGLYSSGPRLTLGQQQVCGKVLAIQRQPESHKSNAKLNVFLSCISEYYICDSWGVLILVIFWQNEKLATSVSPPTVFVMVLVRAIWKPQK